MPRKKPDQAAKPDTPLTRAMAKHPKTGHLMQPFLDEYEKIENQTMAAKNVGVGHETVTFWKKNEDFMSLFTAAHIRAHAKNNDALRSSAVQRSIFGTPHYLIRNGAFVIDPTTKERVVAYRDYETALTMFMLKNRLPDEFRDKFEHEISGQLIVTLASEILTVVRRHVSPEVSNEIQKELETLSAKLVQS